MSLLTVKNVKKVYTTRFGTVRVQALNDVNFSVEEGEYVAIMGESGSGKTTLLNILASLDTATSGQVLLNGQEISRVSQKDLCAFRRDHLGFVFQDFNLLDTMSLRAKHIAPAEDATQLGILVADEIKNNGGDAIIERLINS